MLQSLNCAPTPSTLAQSKERKGSNFAIWQPCPQALNKEESPRSEATPGDSRPHGVATDDGRIDFKEFRAEVPSTATGSSPYWTNKLLRSNNEEKFKLKFFRKENKTNTEAALEEKESLDEEAPLDLSIRPETRVESGSRQKLLEAGEKKLNVSIDFSLDEFRAPEMGNLNFPPNNISTSHPRRLERPSRPPPATPMYPDSSQPTPPPAKRFLSSALQQFYRLVQLDFAQEIELFSLFSI